MVMLTGTQIIIIPAEGAHQPLPRIMCTRLIRIAEVPEATPRAFALHISDGSNKRDTSLSPEESQHLHALLKALPAQDMAAAAASFDGIVYQMILPQAKTVLYFDWQNEDWKYDTAHPKEEWEAVAAVAAYALNLAGF
jgi:hypothetical protein